MAGAHAPPSIIAALLLRMCGASTHLSRRAACPRACAVLSALFICGFIFIVFTLLLMGCYYLYAKYTERYVYAFAIIWLVFVTGLAGLLVVSWRQRAKEDAIRVAEER